MGVVVTSNLSEPTNANAITNSWSSVKSHARLRFQHITVSTDADGLLSGATATIGMLPRGYVFLIPKFCHFAGKNLGLANSSAVDLGVGRYEVTHGVYTGPHSYLFYTSIYLDRGSYHTGHIGDELKQPWTDDNRPARRQIFTDEPVKMFLSTRGIPIQITKINGSVPGDSENFLELIFAYSHDG